MVKNAPTFLLELIIYLYVSTCSTVFDHFDILASDINKFLLLIMESLFIKRDHSQWNKNKAFSLKLFDWDIRR